MSSFYPFLFLEDLFALKAERSFMFMLKACAIHHLDIPWKPADLTQQDGRGIRQGNSFDEVGIYHYLTEEIFDAYMMDIITNKAKFINQIMTSKDPVRVSEDVDEMVLTYSQMQAIASGKPIHPRYETKQTPILRCKQKSRFPNSNGNLLFVLVVNNHML